MSLGQTRKHVPTICASTPAFEQRQAGWDWGIGGREGGRSVVNFQGIFGYLRQSVEEVSLHILVIQNLHNKIGFVQQGMMMMMRMSHPHPPTTFQSHLIANVYECKAWMYDYFFFPPQSPYASSSFFFFKSVCSGVIHAKEKEEELWKLKYFTMQK